MRLFQREIDAETVLVVCVRAPLTHFTEDFPENLLMWSGQS